MNGFNGFNLSTISALYVGSTPYNAIYKGSNLIWNGETPPQPGEDYIRVSTNSLSFNSSAGQQTFTVSSNVSWSITVTGGSGWVTVSPMTHTSVGEDETTVTVSTTENISTRSKQATIQVSNGTITETLTVTQQEGSLNPYYGWPVMPFTEIDDDGGSHQGTVVTPISLVYGNRFNKFALKGYDSREAIVFQFSSWEFEEHQYTDYNYSEGYARTDTVFYNREDRHYYVYGGSSVDLIDLGTEDPTVNPSANI